MYKLLLIPLLMVVWMMLHVLQLDEEMAIQTLFQGKHAVNRAAHAAAQQLDQAELASGRLVIDREAAREKAMQYLSYNLLLDSESQPIEGSLLKEKPEIMVFDIIDGDHSFPYRYSAPDYQFEVTLQGPGVIIIAQLKYPRAFTVLDPIEWNIKGVAELLAS
ncbi:hypothetical protein ACFOQM_09570 [Paenibacillus sp. GCM10012307]|uniref:Uncharacterized protein n=1 Tax=Paenibacillus roseus TaxID=2798579 RepID=A0A934J4I7_9BACL|nr:hypothetical protein [Paenibacillus roseus]MBJ6361534.1 hypothetical protein [Paenibacillus roseus]